MRVVQYSRFVQVVLCVFMSVSTCTNGKSGEISHSIHAIGTNGEWVIFPCGNLRYQIYLNCISLARAIGELAAH